MTKLDRSTMVYALEVRCPFLDQLVNLISNIDFKYLTNSKRTKFIIKISIKIFTKTNDRKV